MSNGGEDGANIADGRSPAYRLVKWTDDLERGRNVNKNQHAPIFVDLDGTLIFGDSLWESAAILCRRNPLALLKSIGALVRGRSAFKYAISAAAKPDGEHFVYNEQLCRELRDESERRAVILATAADRSIAESVAEKLGFFSGVLASDGEINLKGARKLAAIERHLDQSGADRTFDYAGDSVADRPIFDAARRSYVVASSEDKARSLVGGGREFKFFEKPGFSIRDFVKAMRPHQWGKNLLIFAPLALSHSILDFEKVFAAVATFVAFSLCASATYIINDILDIRVDRQHKRKRARPFASGRLGIPDGLAGAFLLLFIGLAVAILFSGGIPVVLMILLYIAITLAYSFDLKQRLLVDAMTLGLLYGHRIVIGAVATGTPVSDWLIAFSVFFFFGLALVKRFSELYAADSDKKLGGRAYEGGDKIAVAMLGIASSFTSIVIFALYVTSPEVAEIYERPRFLWAVCLILLYWISRIWILAYRGQVPDDPVVFAFRDWRSLVAAAACAFVVVAASV